MSDAAPQQPLMQSPILINAQYIKDLSFEIPGAPGIFTEPQASQPELNVQVNLSTEPVRDKTFEVTLRISVEAKVAGKVAFIVDASYAGIFTLNVVDEHIQPVLMIECPRLLFPFARNIVAEVTRDGGFPPVLLQPIDFAALFRQRLEQMAAEQAAQPKQ